MRSCPPDRRTGITTSSGRALRPDAGDAVLRRAKPHPPYGEHIIDDLTNDEAETFLDAARR